MKKIYLFKKIIFRNIRQNQNKKRLINLIRNIKENIDVQIK
jgi:hypothetical protein